MTHMRSALTAVTDGWLFLSIKMYLRTLFFLGCGESHCEFGFFWTYLWLLCGFKPDLERLYLLLSVEELCSWSESSANVTTLTHLQIRMTSYSPLNKTTSLKGHEETVWLLSAFPEKRQLSTHLDNCQERLIQRISWYLAKQNKQEN